MRDKTRNFDEKGRRFHSALIKFLSHELVRCPEMTNKVEVSTCKVKVAPEVDIFEEEI